MKILYCDIDSTINDHRDRIKRNTVGGWPGTVIDQKAFTHEEVMKDKPIPAALYSLNKLFKEYQINFLTSRNWDYPAGTTTSIWLATNGFLYNNLFVVRSHEEKIDFLNNKMYTAFIDDFTIHQEREHLTYIKHVQDAINGKTIRYENNWDEILNDLIA